MQCRKEKVQTMIYKAPHRTLQIDKEITNLIMLGLK